MTAEMTIEKECISKCIRRLQLHRERRESANRSRFIVFLQILLRRLETTGSIQLYQQVKQTVLEQARRNRMSATTTTTTTTATNDSRTPPLVTTLEHQLRNLVGEVHWVMARGATQRYFAKKKQKKELFLLLNSFTSSVTV